MRFKEQAGGFGMDSDRLGSPACIKATGHADLASLPQGRGLPYNGRFLTCCAPRCPAMTKLSHFDDQGASRMVDVGGKPESRRTAKAAANVRMLPSTQALIRDRKLAKGDVLEVARLAGIMAAKQTPALIPLCHPLALESVSLDFAFPQTDVVELTAEVAITGRTGVEMEALTAVSVAALTVYDMCKSVDRGMTIEQVRLEEKTGGRSGAFRR